MLFTGHLFFLELLSEFIEKHPNESATAYRRGIVDDLRLHRKKTRNGTYTEKFCYNYALKYKRLSDIRKSEKGEGVFSSVQRNEWLKEYWWLYDDRRKIVLQVNGFKITVFSSVKKCAERNKVREDTIQNRVKKRLKINGNTFHYLDLTDIEFNIPDFEHRLIK